ncbi:MAG TPA: POTRA domain-containing protein [Planctomycetota bacterium]|nr:POTRA domain-containing protein [Planctomycetota bacterium]
MPIARQPSSSRFLMLLLLLIVVAPAFAAAQNVAELVFDGLPDGIMFESISTSLTQKTGATYDKAQLPANRERVITRLKDLGYLDADARSAVNFVPGGVRLTYAVKARNRYTVESVNAQGIPEADLAAILTAAKIDKETPCTQEVIDRLVPTIAPKLGINVLYIDAEWKANADKKQAVLILRR